DGDEYEHLVAWYRDERVRAFYKAGVTRLLERVNTITGVRYADDPTIFSWELMNESRVASTESVTARREWIAEMARYIKAIDPRHLVAAGLSGYRGPAERAEWLRIHRLPEIDYCDSHFYAQGVDTVASAAALRDAMDDLAQLARFVVGKP